MYTQQEQFWADDNAIIEFTLGHNSARATLIGSIITSDANYIVIQRYTYHEEWVQSLRKNVMVYDDMGVRSQINRASIEFMNEVVVTI